MQAFLTVNGSKDTVHIYAEQTDLVPIILKIQVVVLDDEENRPDEIIPKLYFDDQLIGLIKCPWDKHIWICDYPIPSSEGNHTVTVELPNGCKTSIDVIVMDSNLDDRGTITGIFPRPSVGIVNYENANNASNIKTVDGCRADFYGNACEKTLDYDQLNALCSEFGNLINSAGLDYDCRILTNLRDAVWNIANQSDHEKFLLVEVNETSTSNIGDQNYLPVSAFNRYTLNELYTAFLQNKIDEDKLAKFLIAEMNFNLQFATNLYFRLQARLKRDKFIGEIVDNDGFLVIRIDGKFYLYDETKETLGDYDLLNLGVVSPYVEHVNLTSRSIKLDAGDHKVQLYLIQYNDNPYPTDIKYKENLPRFRVNKTHPVLRFQALKGVNNGL